VKPRTLAFVAAAAAVGYLVRHFLGHGLKAVGL